MVAAAETESEILIGDMVFLPPALFAPLRLHYLVASHRFSAMAACPPSFLAKKSWVGFTSRRADILPLRIMIETKAVLTHSMLTFLSCKIAMVHSNPPSGHPFLRCRGYYTKTAAKVKFLPLEKHLKLNGNV